MRDLTPVTPGAPWELTRDRFLRNVFEARENGYHLVCAVCGVGVFDGSEEHDRRCPLPEDEQVGGSVGDSDQ